MADYSDSDDDMVYQQTSVLLGYAEDVSQQTSEDMISHLGGIPSWLDESSPADARLAKCLSCTKIMPLLLQLDGNIPETPYHKRILYVFGCRSKTCRRKPGSIRAVRGVKVVGKIPAAGAGAGGNSSEGAPKVKEDAPAAPSAPPQNMGNMIFGASSSSGAGSESKNPFASSASSSTNPFATSTSSLNPFIPKKPAAETSNGSNGADPNLTPLSKTFAAVASVKDDSPAADKKESPAESAFYGPPSPWPEASTIPSYPSLFLDASHEELDPESDALTKQAQELAKTSKIEADDDDEMEFDGPSTGSSSKKASSGKGGSKGSKKNDGQDDTESPSQKAFNHFSYIASQNPEQVLRYERNGTPLLYSHTDEVGKLLSSTGPAPPTFAKVPRCKNCSEKRVYELQLMPHTISTLEDAAGVDVLEEGMEWGTVIVATCSKDCTLPGAQKDGGYAEEWAGVQWEELK